MRQTQDDHVTQACNRYSARVYSAICHAMATNGFSADATVNAVIQQEIAAQARRVVPSVMAISDPPLPAALLQAVPEDCHDALLEGLRAFLETATARIYGALLPELGFMVYQLAQARTAAAVVPATRN